MKDSILVIVDKGFPGNRFGPYVGEILRAEGFNCYRVKELSHVTSQLLTDTDVVILTRCLVDNEQRGLLDRYVAAGGHLIVLLPPPILSSLLGLKPTHRGQLDGYLKIDTSIPIGQGLVEETIQFHGVASHYLLDGAQPLARLYKTADLPTEYPAATIHDYGEGRAMAFAYDLAESVVGLRQGNPRLANVFLNVGPGDAFSEGWLDVSKQSVPQADAQQALLGSIVEQISSKPLPRLWYLPGQARSLLVVTGDGEDLEAWSRIENFNQEIEAVEKFKGHITFYLMEEPKVTPEDAGSWLARGHDLGIHPSPSTHLCTMDQKVKQHVAEFLERFKRMPRTVRNHGLHWLGYVEQAKVWGRHGLRMDLNFVSTIKGEGAYMTGSGLPMKFVDEHGEIIDVWQQPTQFEDDVLFKKQFFGLTFDEAIALSTGMIERSIEAFHSPIVMNIHPHIFASNPIYLQTTGYDWTEASHNWTIKTLAFAGDHDVPIWNAEKWLDFTEARYTVEVKDIRYQNGQLTFSLDGNYGSHGLSLMLPRRYGEKNLSKVLRGGDPLRFKVLNIRSEEYVFVNLDESGYEGYFMAEYT